MPDDDLPAPEPPLHPSQPTLLGGLAPDEMLARAMQTVKMTSGATGGWQPPAIEECARLFPGYEVLRLLGRGGMGAVYQARQIELDRLVAIKLLPLEVSVDKDFADRFRREARAMAKLNHPNIIAVHDFGTTREGHLFFVMEYVEGANLADIIHQVGLAPDQSLSIAEQVCIALAYAHNKGIVHRDIKPANVMVDTESHVKVADFGLARLTDPGAEQLGHTMTGTVMGTPDYMAPEQCKGMNVDHRADIYSLGVMIYEMMCREVPKGIFDPPSHRTGCDARIDGIVIRAMQQSPERRYQSTQEMRNDITGARTPLPVPVVGRVSPRAGGTPMAGGDTGPTPAPPRKPRPAARPGVLGAPPRPPQKPPTPMAARPAPVPSAPPETSVMQAIKPPSPALAKKSKLPLYGGIGAGVAALAVAAFFFIPRPEKLTKAQIYAREHAGEKAADASFTNATKDAPFVNSLGMKFVPVPGADILLCIHETRRKDYAAYDAAVPGVDGTWKDPVIDGKPLAQTGDHPVVLVSWEDATAFCDWLSKKEGRTYRLPTEHEWNLAVVTELDDPRAISPADLAKKLEDQYPWGTHNEKDAVKFGNYRGGEDGYVGTAPVMSFQPNHLGIYDLGGNAWEWCNDLFKPGGADRVLRGCGYDNWGPYRKSSTREPGAPNFRQPPAKDFNRRIAGFRVAVATARAPAPAVTPQPAPVTATKDAPFVNTLGMKFVPVPETKVLFSIWDTRVQDYAAYASAKKVDDFWTKQQRDGIPVTYEPACPVAGVSWEDAQAFCQWLTEKEQAEGKLPKGLKYRLPTDEEWSWAVGLPPELGATPVEKSGKNSADYPWGKGYLPTRKVGNYADETFHAKFPKDSTDKKKDQPWIVGYDDGYATTSPVGSFPANAYGLYDMGGNVWQWCEDWFDTSHKDRVVRGASWANYDRGNLLSSNRGRSVPGYRYYGNGFRCVLAPVGTAGGGAPSVVSQTSPGAATPHLSPSTDLWVDAMNNANLLKVAVKEGAALRATDASKGLYIDLGPEIKDGAVRMLFTANATAILNCSVQVRRTPSPTSFYNLHMEPDFTHLGLGIIENAGGRSLKSFRLPVEAVRPAGQPTELELRMVGTTLIAKANGFEAFRLDDSTLAQGHLGIRLDPGVLLHAVQTLDLSKGAVSSPAVPSAAIPLPASAYGWINLLPLIDTQRDTVDGNWRLVNGALDGDGSAARLTLPYAPPEEYDFRIRFTRKSGNLAVAQHVAGARQDVMWIMGGWSNSASGLEQVNGAKGNTNATTIKSGLENERRYESVVEVRHDRVRVELDGQTVVDYKTDWSDFSMNPKWIFPYPKKLGVGCQQPTVFHSIEVHPVGAAPAAARPPSAPLDAPPPPPPPPPPRHSTAPPPTAATKDTPFVNSLGMKFVPVPIVGRVSSRAVAGGDTGPTTPVLFSVWDTRVQDYEVFVKETKREWPKPEFEQGPTHPAVMVSWEDARAFCQWLSQREQAAGRLLAGWNYRLPSDHEWSCAGGIGDREDAAKAPHEKDCKIGDAFPWGTQWPPPKGAGNYAGEELQPGMAAEKARSRRNVIAGYDDGFVCTSPVGSFAANQFGLFDMSGNAQQWCEDWFDKDQKDRVLRGVSWAGFARNHLLLSWRNHDLPGGRSHFFGFRCVLAPVGQSAVAVAGVSDPARPAPLRPATTTAEAGFRSLFDGQTLAGWRSYPSEDLPPDWRVADGAILGGHRSYLVTKEIFGDFDLRLEWKVGPKGNGGIFFRIPPGEGNLPRTAPEFQLCAHDDPDKYKTGALYNVLMSSADVSLPEGQWNTARLVVQGNHVEHWVNDQLVLSYELQSDDWKQHWKAGRLANTAGYAQATQGWIGLQGWLGETAYRNIRIHPLNGGSGASPP